MTDKVWRKCSVCKKEIALGSKYFLCSVGSCSTKNIPVQFCSVDCWDMHDSVMNHRDAGAEEARAPFTLSQEDEVKDFKIEKNITLIRKRDMKEGDTDIMVVVSKTKKYIKERSEFNTAADVMDALSRIVTEVCDVAIENARTDGRKTVLERDIPRVKI